MRANLVIKAWNTMGGMDWTAMPVVAALYGFDDIEIFVAQLTAIRDHLKEKD